MANENKPTYFALQNAELIPINVADKEKVNLSQAACHFIDAWLQRYPQEQKRSGIFAALSYVQEENGGHLTVPLMDAVAEYLQLPHLAAYEIATFYSMYELNPV